ncbi:MAG TPA: hypothetical protein DCR52_05005 [Actinobacteria bacterium]|nr:hypothetical protein [Actinomycetota bacterium]
MASNGCSDIGEDNFQCGSTLGFGLRGEVKLSEITSALLVAHSRWAAAGLEGDGDFRGRVALEFAVEGHGIGAGLHHWQRGLQGEGLDRVSLGVIEAHDGVAFDEQRLTGLNLYRNGHCGRAVDFEGGVADGSSLPGNPQLELEALAGVRIF